MMKRILMFCAIGLVLTANKCNDASTMNLSDMPDLKNTKWVLSELAGSAVNLPDGAQAFLMMDPEQKRVNGSGGCNDLFGSMNLDGTNLSFDGLGATKKFCEGRMDVEKGFMDAMRNTAGFNLDNKGMLSLLGKNGKSLAALKKLGS